uniref:Uncharacterized protein n=1 Tax=Rangifer tarandus platyrhynchus TaxID=3082113 RepID=A0ACB0E987_RANTA|nr:unnamed protein product [Rangifer tarandus platyrhynchus]
MTALSARGHLTLGAVVIRRGEAGGARQRGWAQAESRRRERGPGARARARPRFCAVCGGRSLTCLPPPDTVLFSPLSPSSRLPRRPSGAAGARVSLGKRADPAAGLQGACVRGGAGRAPRPRCKEVHVQPLGAGAAGHRGQCPHPSLAAKSMALGRQL